MPTGYQSRLSNTYWTVDNLTWNGTIWNGGAPVNDFEMTPTGSMDMSFIELRMLMKVIGNLGVGSRLITLSDGGVIKRVYVTPERAQQFVALRIFVPISTIQLAFSPGSIIEIRELEVGYTGLH